MLEIQKQIKKSFCLIKRLFLEKLKIGIGWECIEHTVKTWRIIFVVKKKISQLLFPFELIVKTFKEKNLESFDGKC